MLIYIRNLKKTFIHFPEDPPTDAYCAMSFLLQFQIKVTLLICTQKYCIILEIQGGYFTYSLVLSYFNISYKEIVIFFFSCNKQLQQLDAFNNT